MLELYRSIAPNGSIQQCFQKYLLAGGMPYLANLRYADAPSRQYLHDLFNSVQLKDVVKRNKIREVYRANKYLPPMRSIILQIMVSVRLFSAVICGTSILFWIISCIWNYFVGVTSPYKLCQMSLRMLAFDVHIVIICMALNSYK